MSGPARLVGRDLELAAADGAIADVTGGESRVLAVLGETGIGKSALLSELQRRAEAAGMLVLDGRAAEHERADPAADHDGEQALHQRPRVRRDERTGHRSEQGDPQVPPEGELVEETEGSWCFRGEDERRLGPVGRTNSSTGHGGPAPYAGITRSGSGGR